MTQTTEIYDRGYRAYTGPRGGMGTSMLSVFKASVQRALGLRRKFRFKIVPLATVFIAYVPALGFMTVAVLIPGEIAQEVVADYASYFGLVGIAVTLFTAFVAPELLSSDRRTGMFGLYMASPLQRPHYLLAKGGALLFCMSLVTMLPVFFLLIGYWAAGIGPEGFVTILGIAGRILATGLLLALMFTLIGMAGASLTKRTGFASAGIAMVLIASGVLSDTLANMDSLSESFALANILALPGDLAAVIFDETFERPFDIGRWQVVGAYVLVCTISAAITGWSYRRVEVTK